jgi:uncharacterized membrane protein
MTTAYNRIAGQSIERLAALSDGIFAFAMTLLVLELHLPALDAIRGEHDLVLSLATLKSRLIVYLLSFMTLGIFWVGQQTQLNHLERSNVRLTWIHLGFLFFVTIMPFSTGLLAEFTSYRTALIVYWFNILCLGSALYFSWGSATRSGFIKSEVPPEVPAAVCQRIIVAQTFYAFGTLLCLVLNTHWSIGFIIAVQIYYVVAPRFSLKSTDETA